GRRGGSYACSPSRERICTGAALPVPDDSGSADGTPATRACRGRGGGAWAVMGRDGRRGDEGGASDDEGTGRSAPATERDLAPETDRGRSVGSRTRCRR